MPRQFRGTISLDVQDSIEHGFRYTGGELHRVVFDVADEPYGDVETRLAGLLARD